MHNNILVTGSHRSGSTWVGRVISNASNVAYIHEPFNLHHDLGINTYKFKYWFPFAEGCENIYALKESLSKTLSFQYAWGEAMRDMSDTRSFARVLRDGTLFSYHRLLKHRALVKDPIAVFSVEWLEETFDLKPVIVIRHPAAFVSSLIKAGWTFPFKDLLAQPKLMERISVFRKGIEDAAKNNNKSILEQGVLLWNIIHFVISSYKEKHPEWCYVLHENLSKNPVDSFRTVFEYLELPYTEDCRAKIVKSTNYTKVEASKPNDLRINSSENVLSWKKRLSQSEINYIRNETESISKFFYTDEDWGE